LAQDELSALKAPSRLRPGSGQRWWGAMATPIILQAMWLLLASAASAGLDTSVTRSVQREFPQLAHVIYSICGLKDLDFSVSHPCAFSIFGMAYAFTECGVVHRDDYKNFQPCVLGCTTDDRCSRACADPEVKNEHCLANCQVVASCIKKVTADSDGHVSAKEQLSQCFAEKPPEPEPIVTIIATPADSVVAPAASPAFPPAPATVLMATRNKLAPAPAPALAAPPAMGNSPAPASVDGFLTRQGTLSVRRGLVEPGCFCSKTGIIHGVDTAQPGCAKHSKERLANVEAYCYVEGGFKCGGAMKSDLFPGVFWVNCEKPNLAVLYPPTCEILVKSEAKLFDVPADLGLKVPPATFDDLRGDMAPVPAEGNPMEKLNQDISSWGQPLPPMWHASRDNYFVDGAILPPVSAGPASAPGAAPATSIVMAPAAAPPTTVVMGPAAAPAATLLEEHSRLRGVQQH